MIYNFMRRRALRVTIEAGLATGTISIAEDRETLRALHDSLWLNGNVPIALQRCEQLGLTDELTSTGLPIR